MARPSRNSSSRAHLRQHERVVGLLEPLEDPERVGDQDSAGAGRRVGQHLPALVADARRLALDDLVGGEILARDEAAALQHPVADRRRDVARIEEAGALRAQALQQIPKLRQPDRVALAQQLAIRRVDRLALPRGTQDRLEDREQEGLHPHHLDPLACRPRQSHGRPRLTSTECGVPHTE